MRETYIDEDGYTYETRPYGARRYVDSPELEAARDDLKAARTRHGQLGVAYDEERNPVVRDQLRMDYLLACTDVTRAEIAVEIAERHLREREDDYGYIAVDGTRVPYGSGKPAFHLDQDGNAVDGHDGTDGTEDDKTDASEESTACRDDDGGADEAEWILMRLADYIANVDEAVTCALRDVDVELGRDLRESYDRIPAKASDAYRVGFNCARTSVVSTMVRLLDQNEKIVEDTLAQKDENMPEGGEADGLRYRAVKTISATDGARLCVAVLKYAMIDDVIDLRRLDSRRLDGYRLQLTKTSCRKSTPETTSLPQGPQSVHQKGA